MLTSTKKHIDSLTPELMGRVFQSGLTVVDRLHCERVSPRWKWIVGAFGWSEQRKLDGAMVFEGATDEREKRFTHAHLLSLLHRVAGPKIVELDFRSLERELYPTFVVQIAECLRLFPNLRALNITVFNLHDFVDFLPLSLLDLHTWGPISVQTLRKLAVHCPNLERVPFRYIIDANMDIVNEFMGKFPRQKTLNHYFYMPNNAAFETIGEQKQLVELTLRFYSDFNEENERAFEAMLMSCKNLQKIHFSGIDRMTERSLLHLAKMPNLAVLELCNPSGAFTDSVLMAIAKRGQLIRLRMTSDELTDEAIVYLVDQCKSLVSLELFRCPRITDRSLRAVVAEIRRRHGLHPRTLPIGPNDKGIFFFAYRWTKIKWPKFPTKAAQNPWLNADPNNTFLGDHRFDSVH